MATLLLVPYLALALAWLGSTPPGGAPDEPAHLVKALGAGRLDLGTPYAGPLDPDLATGRNQSISRTVTVPARLLLPTNTLCYIFRPEVSAACLEQPTPPAPDGDVRARTVLGAYPPFLYVPVGLVARTATTAHEALTLARGVVLLWSALLLWLASWHLTRWLGPRALLGVLLAATPTALFCLSVLTTSGIEITGALVVAAVVSVASFAPQSLRSRRTQALTAVGGASLVLSRQLGVVTLGFLVLVLLAVGGWREVTDLVRRRSRSMLTAVGALGVATASTLVWELVADHPARTGSPFDPTALRRWVDLAPGVARQGVAVFGWLDVPVPDPVSAWWLVVGTLVVMAALVVGRWRDRAVLLGTAATVAVVGGLVYASVFAPIGSSVQGRHLLPLAALVPVHAGVVLARRLPHRVGSLTLATVGVLLLWEHGYGLWRAGQRYAVGLTAQTPWWFLPRAEWSPPLGWAPWLGLGMLGVMGLVAVVTSLALPGRAPAADGV